MNKLIIIFIGLLLSCNSKHSVKSGNNYHSFTNTVTFKERVNFHSNLHNFVGFSEDDTIIGGKINNIYPFFVNLIEIKGKDTICHIAFYEKIKDTAYLKGDIKLIFREIGNAFEQNWNLLSSSYDLIDSLEKEINKLKTQ